MRYDIARILTDEQLRLALIPKANFNLTGTPALSRNQIIAPPAFVLMPPMLGILSCSNAATSVRVVAAEGPIVKEIFTLDKVDRATAPGSPVMHIIPSSC